MSGQDSVSKWGPESVRALRRHLGLTQDRMAQELGTRQQTISEWERGLYTPRGASHTLLRIVAERAGFQYQVTGSASTARGIEPSEDKKKAS